MPVSTIERPQLEAHESLPMFVVSEELAPRIAAFGLEQNVRDMAERGYTAFDSGVSDEFLDTLREAIRRNALEQKGHYFDISENGASCDMLLAKDDIFAQAVTNAKVLTMIEYMCGKGALVSQISGSVRLQGAKAMPLHCDQDWLPSPMPEHNALLTACWYMDDIDEAGAGATKVIPASHLLRRQPTPTEVASETGAVPILCKKGSVALWDGRLWHCNYGRSLPGERILLHATYCRLAYRPLEDYGSVEDELIARHGPVMANLFGRNLWFGNRKWNRGGVDMTKYENTWLCARR